MFERMVWSLEKVLMVLEYIQLKMFQHCKGLEYVHSSQVMWFLAFRAEHLLQLSACPFCMTDYHGNSIGADDYNKKGSSVGVLPRHRTHGSSHL